MYYICTYALLFSYSMHICRVTEYMRVLANMFLERNTVYVCTRTQNTCTHAHILVGFLLMLKTAAWIIANIYALASTFLLFQDHCKWYWMSVIILMQQTLYRLRQCCQHFAQPNLKVVNHIYVYMYI